MARLDQQYTVGTSEQFRSRVQMAMIRHAQYRVAQGNDAQGLVTLGRAVLAAPVGYAETFARVIATEPSVQTGVGTAPTTGEDVTDEQIVSAVETVFPSFAR